MKKLISLILVLALCMSVMVFPACADDVAALAGTYMLDAAPLGMPLQIYLIIDGEGNFGWTNKLEGGADKGHGVIGGQDGLYVMMYSDSTAEAAKTTSFTLDGQNLVFSARIPYGSSGFNPNTEDPENVIYPVAKKMAYEEYLGTYVGTYVSESMMGTVTYDIELVLSLGAEFTLSSAFSAMGESLVYTVNGNFEIVSDENGDFIYLTADDFEGKGQFAENDFTMSSRLSAQSASLKDYTLDAAVTADVAGDYAGYKLMEMMGLKITALLSLGKTGRYTYTAVCEGEAPYEEEGFFTAENGKITLYNDAEGTEPVECTLENEILAAKMRIHNDVPMSTAIDFYSPAIYGSFTADGEDEAGWKYESVLTLNYDGTYGIAVTCEGVECYTEEGTFATAASMAGTSLILTDASGFDTTGIVSEDGVNITHVVNGSMDTLGFKYVK